MAYHCEQVDQLHLAAYLYEELMILQPDHVQSYRNLAHIYAKIGRYKSANNLFRQMLFNTISGLDFSSIEPLVIREYKRFLSKFRSRVDFSDLPEELLVIENNSNTRLVFEWTDPMSEFEIQFVSPDKKYYTWTHSAFESRESITNGIDQGFAIKEFMIDGAISGEWVINLNRLNEPDENVQTMIKYSVYKDYGLKNESVKTKMISLDQLKEKVTMDTFLN